ncbi:unnamed protein product [Miscanthus lutarioriparius]|uniref:t-SNARE coiled-coil homology domain-containing protein n=1 Tax=Miscanthus lutarioriparius TaxID=422564 RepID=A0A811NYZ0_9POAL|nr:unnamed protein product [Miscanthus lutarioriparius]
MSFQDLEAGHVRGAPLGGGRRNGRGAAGEGVAGAGASQAVASGVFQINTAVATFQRLVNTLGTPKDTPDLRDRIYISSEVNNGADKLAEQRTQLLESRRQELVFLDNEIVFNEAIIEERDQGIQEIQHQITEVNEIFKDLAVLVHDQGAMIDDIDSHIENAVVATSQAKGQLSKAAKTQKSNSSLICLLLVIFRVVLLIVIIPGMNPGIRPEVSRRRLALCLWYSGVYLECMGGFT